jgi:hypothetical protein
VVSSTHDLVSPIVDNTIAGPACTAHSVLTLKPAFAGTSALRSYPPMMVESHSHFRVGGSGFGVS